jgi:hypothetical protein
MLTQLRIIYERTKLLFSFFQWLSFCFGVIVNYHMTCVFVCIVLFILQMRRKLQYPKGLPTNVKGFLQQAFQILLILVLCKVCSMYAPLWLYKVCST